MYHAPRGTEDILPAEQAYWRYVEQKAEAICQLYGYERIESPAMEETGLFNRGVGEGTDIVEKEMYTFDDRGGNSLTLRPEGTAPVCRAYLEHGMHNLPQPVKLYYFASIFRYERPQAGRYREHHQFGCEAIGEQDPALDAEVIDMAWRFFHSLGLNDLTLQLNSIGCKICRPNYLAALKDYYINQQQELCSDCKSRIEKNPLRLLDCKKEQCQAVADAAPKSIDHLCPDCADHFNKLRKYLTLLELPFNINHRLVRGLDYYTRTVFEIQPLVEGGQTTIGGGGRYDNLIEELGGNSTPAIGFATGIERIILNIKKQNISVTALPSPKVFIAYIGDIARDETLKLAASLRKEGIAVIEAKGAKSLKAQLRQADARKVKHAIIIGENEIATRTVTLREMSTAVQKTVPLGELADLLKA